MGSLKHEIGMRLDFLRRLKHGNGIELSLIHPTVKLGKDVSIMLSVIAGEVEIGDGVKIAPFVVIVSWCHITKKHLSVKIGKNVWIGANSTITQGCVIGDNAIIGANSVLTRKTRVGKGEVWAGSSAKRIKP